MAKIVLGRVDAARLKSFEEAYPQATFVCCGSEEEMIREIADADALFGIPSRDAFAAARSLRWIQAPSAGVEFLLGLPEAVESDVLVTNARGAHARTIAEHTFAMLLAFTRGLRYFDKLKAQHEWARRDGYQQVTGIAGLTMAVVGFGNIGKAIARRALAFEMEVIGVDAHQVPGIDGVKAVWTLDRLDDALKQADVLVIATPITPETRGMIGKRELGLLKPGSYLLAISRGGIVDEPALAEALNSGHLAAAGLDVTDVEPLPAESPLWDVENLIITPHVSGGSRLTTELMWTIFHDNVGRFLRGETLNNLCDKRLGY